MTGENQQIKKVIQATIDQLDAELAVLVSDELTGPIYLPSSGLPLDSQEGDILLISISRQEATTQKRKTEVVKLIEKLASAKAKRSFKQRQ